MIRECWGFCHIYDGFYHTVIKPQIRNKHSKNHASSYFWVCFLLYLLCVAPIEGTTCMGKPPNPFSQSKIIFAGLSW